jgi:hypothetical protein
VDDTPLEASPADVAEQRAEVAPDDTYDLDDPIPAAPALDPGDVGWDADPADVAEQRAEVPLDDEDWA